jgi:hypothetical protein
VIAFELVCGRLPFPPREGDTPLAVLFRHITEPVPPVRTLRPDADARLAEWIERLLAKEPERRPASAAAAADELEELTIAALGPLWRRRAALPSVGPKVHRAVMPARNATPAPTPAPAPAPERRRGRRAAVLGGVIAVAAIAVAATALTRAGGGGSGSAAHGALPAGIPDCMRTLTANTPHGSVVAGTSNQPFAQASQTRDKPATVVFLEAATPVLAMRVTDHPGANPPVFAIDRTLDARCRTVALTNFGEGTSSVAIDWAPLRMTLAGHPYQAAFDHDTRHGTIEASLRRLPTPSLTIGSAAPSGRGIRVSGKLAPDAGKDVTVSYDAPSGARYQATATPSGGLFQADIKLPQGESVAAAGKVSASYPGDDTYAGATATVRVNQGR